MAILVVLHKAWPIKSYRLQRPWNLSQGLYDSRYIIASDASQIFIGRGFIWHLVVLSINRSSPYDLLICYFRPWNNLIDLYPGVINAIIPIPWNVPLPSNVIKLWSTLSAENWTRPSPNVFATSILQQTAQILKPHRINKTKDSWVYLTGIWMQNNVEVVHLVSRFVKVQAQPGDLQLAWSLVLSRKFRNAFSISEQCRLETS